MQRLTGRSLPQAWWMRAVPPPRLMWLLAGPLLQVWQVWLLAVPLPQAWQGWLLAVPLLQQPPGRHAWQACHPWRHWRQSVLRLPQGRRLCLWPPRPPHPQPWVLAAARQLPAWLMAGPLLATRGRLVLPAPQAAPPPQPLGL